MNIIKIGCIIILFNPEKEILINALDNIIPEVDSIFIGDNTPVVNTMISKEIKSYSPLISYHHFGANIGIASAQNFGIRYYIQEKFDYILFLDQDSIPPIGMVNKLLNSTMELKNNGVVVGGIGPRPFNRKEGKIYVGRVKKGKSIQKGITEVSEIINSASLISVANFKIVGLMEDQLFIDGVDHEWCWRAKKVGKYRFFILEDVFLNHQLGEGDRFFLIRKVAIPTPFRTYYQFRNYFKLVKRRYVPLYWKYSNGFKYLIKLFYYPIFVRPRKEYLKNIFNGIRDGVTSKIIK